MGDATEMPSRKLSAELLAIFAVGVTVLLAVFGQAAWLDGKIERVEAKLSGELKRVEDRLDIRITSLQQGQAAIRERLAAVESHIAAVPVSMQEQAES